MTDKVAPSANKSKSELRAEREERLARALRDNLARRKAQSRARADEGSEKKDPS